MRILFPIACFYPSQIGGPCNSLYWHTSELLKHSINIEVVTTTLGIKEGLVKQDVFYNSECGNIYYGKKNKAIIKNIIPALNKIKNSDIIHLNGLFSIFSIIVFFYLKLFYKNKKIVWSVRGELNKNALIYSSLKKKIVLFMYRKLRENICFHSTSDQETIDIKSNFKNSKVIQFPNFIIPATRVLQDEVKKQLLYIGRIHSIKAIHKIIEGLSLSEEFLKSDFKFIIVGKHEERHKSYLEDLLKLIAEKKLDTKIEFRGHLIGEEKELIYAQSYATLLLSETENFGNVVLESLNQGTPVIASTGTPWSILEKYKCGYHILNEPAIIAKKVDQILKLDTNEYSLFRKNAVQLVENEFAIENKIHQWVNKYNEVLASDK